MRILQVNKYHYIKGGADTVFFNTTALLRSNGHEVAEFCTQNDKNIPSEYDCYFAHAPELRDQGVAAKIAGIPRFFSNPNAAKRLEELIAHFKPDVAHLHNIFNGLSLSILTVLRRHRIPVVITMHDTRFICPSSYFLQRGKACEKCLRWGGLYCGLKCCYQDNLLNSWMCALEMLHKEYLFDYDRCIDRYIFASRRFKGFHEARHSYFASKGTVLYNFLPGLPQIVPSASRGDYMLYYGRVTAEKGISTLVEAMERMPNIKLKVAGTGPLLDVLSSRAPHNVEFLGFLSGSSLFDVVRNASFVLVPSECEENNPLTVIEAYAHGKPVIGSRIGGVPEIITPHTGFTFTPGSIAGLCDAMAKADALTDAGYERMSAAARTFADENFHPGKYYSRLMDIYNEAINCTKH